MGFFLLYHSCRVAEYLLVNIGDEMHCSKTVQKEKYILKREPKLKENKKSCCSVVFPSAVVLRVSAHTIHYFTFSAFTSLWVHKIIVFTVTKKKKRKKELNLVLT